MRTIMAKTTRAKVDRRKTPPTPAPAAAQTAPEISADAIARRAFEHYCARGSGHGQDLQDWLQAERELLTGEQGSA
jgi:DUF2934 family protein